MQQWSSSSKEIFTFDKYNNLIELVGQLWSEEQWKNTGKVTYQYNNHNKLTMEVWAEWELAQWVAYKRYICTYDENNITSILYQWGAVEWKDLEKTFFFYNKHNNLTSCIYQIRKFEQLENDELVSFFYDTQNNITSLIWQRWWDEKWVNKEKYIYFFDENNNGYEGYCQAWFYDSWIDYDNPLDIYYNNMQSEKKCWGQRFSVSYVKKSVTGFKENVINNNIKLYPNPVLNILQIETASSSEIPKVKIFSIQGAVLIDTKGNQIDVSFLPSGIYIVEIGKAFGKIVKL